MADSDHQSGDTEAAAEALRLALERVRARLELAPENIEGQAAQTAALRPMLDVIEALNQQLTAYSVAQSHQHGTGAVLARVQLASMLHGCRYWVDLMDLQLTFMRDHPAALADADEGSQADAASPDPALIDALGQHLQRLSVQWDRQVRIFHAELEALFDQLRERQAKGRHHRVKP